MISGFTMVRNAEKYYFPLKESILSILPLVDEFIVALGDGDDNTLQLIQDIGSDKIRIFKRQWDESAFKDGNIFRDETNFALAQCRNRWCFYLQADEVVHETDLPIINKACEKYIDREDIDGFLFKYRHFWGDHDHLLDFHGWYNREIRIIRNHSGIFSYKDAQSFQKGGGEKLNVIELPAYIYHYGWVRPPELMRAKKKEQDMMHWGRGRAEEVYKDRPLAFSYGALGRIPLFKGRHPAVMKEWIARHNWKDKLNYGKTEKLDRKPFKHERRKYRVLTRIEKLFLGGRRLFGFKNWIINGREKA